MIYVASVNGSTSAEKFHKGKSETNFPLTILIRAVEGFLQFVGSIHHSGPHIHQLEKEMKFFEYKWIV